jgi:hypothetical protein
MARVPRAERVNFAVSPQQIDLPALNRCCLANGAESASASTTEQPVSD